MSTRLSSVSEVKGALTNSEFVANYIGGGSYIPTMALNHSVQAKSGLSAIDLANLNLNNERSV